ncbi:MAG: SMC-Scp complex subunit ScpB [Opitutales bacterium]|nr:SMC-Scp complex subunit ScpB [Opitutales bacterium]
MEFNLKKILKALLFSSGDALSTKDVQAVITRFHAQSEEDEEDSGGAEESPVDGGQGVMRDLLAQVPSLLTTAQIRDAFAEISQELEDANDVWRVVEGPSGYRLAVAPQYADWVRLLRDEPRPRRLSAAALETLAVIAYRQPVTRSEIEAVRGVSSDSGVNRLIEKELVHIVGRADLPGRPLQYATTDAFLEFCGIRSLEELPASDVLSPSQITEWIRKATMPDSAPDAADMGLPTDGDEEAHVVAEDDNGGDESATDSSTPEENPPASTPGGVD